MARKVEIIITDDNQIVVLGYVTKGGLNLFELTERNFAVPTLEDSLNVAANFLEPVNTRTFGTFDVVAKRRG